MNNRAFDCYAEKYDAWFFNNTNLLYSEAALVAKALGNPGKTLSVGCGSGLFEMILKKDYNIEATHGIEPGEGMAEIAVKRGMKVKVATAEEADFGISEYDTIMFNGTPSYISDLAKAFEKSRLALRPGGRIVVVDVPKEGTYATLYNLAMTLDTWNNPLLNDIKPADPYPIEFIRKANWRTTAEKIELLEKAGFAGLEFWQTLTKHPKYSNVEIEQPQPGRDRGDYVAIIGRKG